MLLAKSLWDRRRTTGSNNPSYPTSAVADKGNGIARLFAL